MTVSTGRGVAEAKRTVTVDRGTLLRDGGATERESGELTVLLADDDDGFRETLRIWLESEPRWDVREATNGAETLAVLDETVDVLVLDRRMPELRGSQVVDRLDETSFDGTVVVVSAYEPDEYLAESDVATYLVKPVDRGELVEQVAACVE